MYTLYNVFHSLDSLLDLPSLPLSLLGGLLSLDGVDGLPVILRDPGPVLVRLGLSLPGQLVPDGSKLLILASDWTTLFIPLDLVQAVEHELHQRLGLLNRLLQALSLAVKQIEDEDQHL